MEEAGLHTDCGPFLAWSRVVCGSFLRQAWRVQKAHSLFSSFLKLVYLGSWSAEWSLWCAMSIVVSKQECRTFVGHPAFFLNGKLEHIIIRRWCDRSTWGRKLPNHVPVKLLVTCTSWISRLHGLVFFLFWFHNSLGTPWGYGCFSLFEFCLKFWCLLLLLFDNLPLSNWWKFHTSFWNTLKVKQMSKCPLLDYELNRSVS